MNTKNKIYGIFDDIKGKIVAYTIITGLESDYDLSEEEILQDRIYNAVDDGVLEDGVYFYKRIRKIVKGLKFI